MSNKGKGKQARSAQAAPAPVDTSLASTPAPAPQAEAPKPTLVVDNEPATVLKARAFWAKHKNIGPEAHALAVEFLEHAQKHGDFRALLAFQNEMPRVFRKVEFAAWVARYAPVTWGKRDKDDNCDGIKMAKEGEKGFKPFNVTDAKANPFYLTPEAEKTFKLPDWAKIIQSKIKAIDKALGDTSIKRENNETDEQLRAQKADGEAALAALYTRKSNVA